MKTIGIIAEFNPFHNGHAYLIEKCKKDLGADRVIVVMSGDFVQRGAPAIMDKFARTKMAIRCGADVVIELPVYYSLGSAEYFAMGAVSILNRLGCVDHLGFGSEDPDIDKLERIADILCNEPKEFSEILSGALKEGLAYPAALEKAFNSFLAPSDSQDDPSPYHDIFSSPNSILAIEYLKSLKKTDSRIMPYTIKRIGQNYHSLDTFGTPSASGIRARLLSASNLYIKSSASALLTGAMPQAALEELEHYTGMFLNSNDFSTLVCYRLVSEKNAGFTKYLDITKDLSNKIVKNLDYYESFSGFCSMLKSKDILHSRISRCLMHILLGITSENMAQYKADGYTSYCRILGFRESAKDLLGKMNENSTIPVITRLKDADRLLNPLQMRLFEETLVSGSIYNTISRSAAMSEYRMKPIIL